MKSYEFLRKFYKIFVFNCSIIFWLLLNNKEKYIKTFQILFLFSLVVFFDTFVSSSHNFVLDK